MTLTVERFMTRSPLTVGHDQPLAVAHRMMREHRVRHLPVLDGGTLVGVVSQRDLYLIETLSDVDVESVVVEEAMTREVETLAPDTPLKDVVIAMLEKRISSVVIARARHVVGIFTTVDALGALSLLLADVD